MTLNFKWLNPEELQEFNLTNKNALLPRERAARGTEGCPHFNFVIFLDFLRLSEFVMHNQMQLGVSLLYSLARRR